MCLLALFLIVFSSGESLAADGGDLHVASAVQMTTVGHDGRISHAATYNQCAHIGHCAFSALIPGEPQLFWKTSGSVSVTVPEAGSGWLIFPQPHPPKYA